MSKVSEATKMKLCFLVVFCLYLLGLSFHTYQFNSLRNSTELNRFLWHAIYMVSNLLGMWALLASRPLGYWFLVAAMIWQIPTESYYSFKTLTTVGMRGLGTFSQIIEPLLNVLGLFCVYRMRKRFEIKP